MIHQSTHFQWRAPSENMVGNFAGKADQRQQLRQVGGATLGAGVPIYRIEHDAAIAMAMGADLETEQPVWYTAIVAAAIAAYYVVLPTTGRRATYGKSIAGLIVVGPQGARLGIGRSLVRYLMWGINLFLVPCLLVLLNRKHQGIHDIVAGTLVLQRKSFRAEALSAESARPKTGTVIALVSLCFILPILAIFGSIVVPAYNAYIERTHGLSGPADGREVVNAAGNEKKDTDEFQVLIFSKAAELVDVKVENVTVEERQFDGPVVSEMAPIIPSFHHRIELEIANKSNSAIDSLWGYLDYKDAFGETAAPGTHWYVTNLPPKSTVKRVVNTERTPDRWGFDPRIRNSLRELATELSAEPRNISLKAEVSRAVIGNARAAYSVENKDLEVVSFQLTPKIVPIQAGNISNMAWPSFEMEGRITVRNTTERVIRAFRVKPSFFGVTGNHHSEEIIESINRMQPRETSEVEVDYKYVPRLDKSSYVNDIQRNAIVGMKEFNAEEAWKGYIVEPDRFAVSLETVIIAYDEQESE